METMSVDRWTDKENGVHLDSGIPLSHTKEQNNASCSNFDGSRDYHTKWSKSVKVAQSCLILCDPIDYTVHGVLQATILEWVAFPFCRGSFQLRDLTQVSSVAGSLYQLSLEATVYTITVFWRGETGRARIKWDNLGTQNDFSLFFCYF